MNLKCSHVHGPPGMWDARLPILSDDDALPTHITTSFYTNTIVPLEYCGSDWGIMSDGIWIRLHNALHLTNTKFYWKEQWPLPLGVYYEHISYVMGTPIHVRMWGENHIYHYYTGTWTVEYKDKMSVNIHMDYGVKSRMVGIEEVSGFKWDMSQALGIDKI